MAATPLRNIRVPDDEWQRWAAEAKAEGVSRTAWIIARCGRPMDRTWDDRIADTAAAPPPTEPTPTPEPGCPHPRGSLTVLGAGLKRCGACGTNSHADGSWPRD